MTPADRARPSIGQRLADSAPWLYAAVGPSGRAVRRAVDLVRQRFESREFEHRLLSRSSGESPGPGPRILLDGACFQDPPTGIGRVWEALMPAWSEGGFAKHVTVLDRGETAPRHAGFTYLDAPRVRAFDSKGQRRMLQAACDAVHADLFVSTLYTTPTTTPSLVFLQDLIPEVLGWDLRQPMWRDKARAIRRAAAFAVPSESTARDLRRLYADTARRPLTVTPLGVSPAFAPAAKAQIEAFRSAHGLPDDYFVLVGHRTVHKNAELVFRAAALARDGGAGFALLLVGGSPRLEPRFRRIAPDVQVRLAQLNDADLRAAYSGARATLYPSRHEGFGLVLLEAMACGCPVITCRNSSLPEAAGDAALYVGEDDPAAMLDAMREVADPTVRADMVRRGSARAAGFRWERTAEALEAAIRGAAS